MFCLLNNIILLPSRERMKALMQLCYLVCLFLSFSLSAASTHTYIWAKLNSWSGFGYYEYLPNSYNPSTSDKHPVLIHLHGVRLSFF